MSLVRVADGPTARASESIYIPETERFYYRDDSCPLYVSAEVIKGCRDWSKPVQFKFVEQYDGSVPLWYRTVDDDPAA